VSLQQKKKKKTGLLTSRVPFFGRLASVSVFFFPSSSPFWRRHACVCGDDLEKKFSNEVCEEGKSGGCQREAQGRISFSCFLSFFFRPFIANYCAPLSLSPSPPFAFFLALVDEHFPLFAAFFLTKKKTVENEDYSE
jgi:hypothetical protein